VAAGGRRLRLDSISSTGTSLCLQLILGRSCLSCFLLDVSSGESSAKHRWGSYEHPRPYIFRVASNAGIRGVFRGCGKETCGRRILDDVSGTCRMDYSIHLGERR
jgi:hypothetical protein